MQKIDDFISKVPGIIVKVIQEQQNFTQYQNYLQNVKNDIKYFKKHGTFPKVLDGDVENGQNKKVLNESTIGNVLQIKLERISGVPQNKPDVESTENDYPKENVKLEMPPPQLPIKKNRKTKKKPSITNTRSTRSKASREIHENSDNVGRDSDIVLQKQVLDTITLNDSDSEDIANTSKGSKQSRNELEDKKIDTGEIPIRTTRTRMKKNDSEENGKRNRSPSNTIELKDTGSSRQVKRKKSKESPEEDTSEYENPSFNLTKAEETKCTNRNIPQETLNATYVKKVSQINNTNDNFNETDTIPSNIQNTPVVLKKNQPYAIDKTVIKGKPNLDNDYSNPNLKDIMTDDEDDNVIVTMPKRDTYHIKPGAKAIYNPFQGSPVKKRVEAYEKLVTEEPSGIPVHATRNKTRLNAREKEKETLPPKLPKPCLEMKSSTPKVANRYLATISSANKALKTNVMNESVLPAKASSALKASHQEFNEKESRRREKESEAMKKRVAQLQAQAEEKRKKGLEKRTKAQQLREIHERSKVEAFKEAEKAKEERHKQLLAEKQEKAKKQQEESERRRAEAPRKALEEKRKEDEEKRVAEETHAHLKQEELRKKLREDRKAAKALEQKKKPRVRLPIFLREKAPLLATEDCYDSDHEGAEIGKMRKPWTSSQRIFPQLDNVMGVSKYIITSFFLMTSKTPNLQDIFENIDPSKLKRTSSAIWKAPPRYTLMPESIEEKDEEDY